MKSFLKKLHVAYEGRWVIVAALGGFIVLALMIPSWAFLCAALFLCILLFFRDPRRDIPQEPTTLVSPADGRVTDIERVCLPHIGDVPFRRIGIFLSIFNVHVQRFPCAGVLESKEYSPGVFRPAFSSKASQDNESNTLLLRTVHGPVVVKQITGAIARRIHCDVPLKEEVTKGQRLGIIMFGSRVELYLPENFETLVSLGDRVTAGETIVGLVP